MDEDQIDLDAYPYPEMSSLTLDEAALLHDVAGVVLEDFVPAHPDAKPEEKLQRDQTVIAAVRNPRFRQAILQIALMRKDKSLTVERSAEIARAIPAVAVARWFWDGDDDPPTVSSQSEPGQPSSSRLRSVPSTSGSSSTSDSGDPAEIQQATGTTG